MVADAESWMDQLLHAAGIPQRVPIFDDAPSRDELVDRLGRELLVVCSGIMLTLPRKRRGSVVLASDSMREPEGL
jgi:hypothetical protein